MVVLKIILSFFLLLTLLPAPVNSTENYQYWCLTDAGSYATNTTYNRNLNAVLSTLSHKSLVSSSYTATIGHDTNAVHGLFYCTADIGPEDCTTCVRSASNAIKELCPNEKGAVIWHPDCMLRYANPFEIHGADSDPYAWWCSMINVTMDLNEFGDILRSSFDGLIKDIANNTTGSLLQFGTKTVDLSSGGKLDLMVQCAPDVDFDDCGWCLQSAFSVLVSKCGLERTWTMVSLPDCLMRYESSPSLESPSGVSPLLTPRRPRDRRVVIVVVPTIVGAGFFILVGVYLCVTKRVAYPSLVSWKKEPEMKSKGRTEPKTAECKCFKFQTLEAATKGFSSLNKLGEGGFGVVYQGLLQNGRRVAVKRLSNKSGQGDEEFKTEVEVVAKLHHKNLVKLTGFCVEGDERLIVYEFMPNLSLDLFLFDPEKSFRLTWKVRYKIILGIANGLQYLHEDSRVSIVHRDLKTSNILLDDEFEPKIADFGMARLVEVDQTSQNTTKVVGTYGYMAPEYVATGEFSVKTDVFSFGVIVLEILSGKCNSTFYQTSRGVGLFHHAQRIQDRGAIEELMDPVLGRSFSRIEAQRCLEIGLLCVQEDESVRPSMNTVLHMFNDSVGVPLPFSSWNLSANDIKDHDCR